MPANGYIAFCIRPGCEWIATDGDGDGESREPRLFSQLAALAAVDEHLRVAHRARIEADYGLEADGAADGYGALVA